MFLKRQCTVFSILFAFAEKGEAGSGELEAAGQRASHPGAAEASLRGSGQGGPWRTRQVWRGAELGNQGPILLRDQVSSVPVPQTCVSQALRPVHVEEVSWSQASAALPAPPCLHKRVPAMGWIWC